jgi:hypothetical protein
MSAFNGHSGAREITIPNANHGNVAKDNPDLLVRLQVLLSGTAGDSSFHTNTGSAP